MYLGRDVRTVMRWERTRHLPVHRLPGGPKSAVYALKSELDAWRSRRGIHVLTPNGTRERSAPSPSTPTAPSIAVLPFANLSADKENEYFSDGLGDEIITALTRIEGLRVTARTSSFAFRGQQQDVREIGAKLGVTALLEGSVRRAGGRVRVSAQLVSATDGFHLWSEHYDRELVEIFAIQEGIATSIAAALKLKMRPQAGLRKKATANSEAYNLWLKGRHYQHGRRTLGDYTRSGEYYSQAIALDPDYAEPHLGLAQHFLNLSAFGLLAPQEAARQGRAEVQRALQLDDSLGEAHAVLGMFRALSDFDWPGAECAFTRALACAPGSPLVHRAYAGSVLTPKTRLEEAEAAARHALTLDPLSPECHCLVAMVLFFRRRYDQAESSIRIATELGAGHPFGEWIRAVIAALQGRFEEAIMACESAARLFGGAPVTSAGLGMVYG